jgi:hemerythrin
MDDDFVVWEDSYSLGIPVIDEQHKKLVKMINDIFENCKKEENNATKAIFFQAFKETGDYAQTHFSEEEGLLKKNEYPDLPEHKKQHESFMNHVWDEFDKFNRGKEAPIGLARHLKKWLLTHIAVVDKKYVPYLKK